MAGTIMIKTYCIKFSKDSQYLKKIISESVAMDWGETLDSQAARWTFALP